MESAFLNGGVIGQSLSINDDARFISDVTNEIIVGGTVGENGTLNLSTPGGQTFTRVAFASYGNPGGTSPNFTLGGCNASNSVSIVESYALGQSSVAIPATNGVFGDPCPGTPKSLAVALAYNQNVIGYGNTKNSGLWSLRSVDPGGIVTQSVTSNVNFSLTTTTNINFSSLMVGFNNSLIDVKTITSPTITALNYTRNYIAGTVLVFAFSSRTSVNINNFSITDTKGNTFTRIVENTQSNGLTVTALFSTILTTGVTTGDTFTIATTGSSTSAIGIAIYELGGTSIQVTDTNSLQPSQTSISSGTFSQSVNAQRLAIQVISSGTTVLNALSSQNFTNILSNITSGSSTFISHLRL